MRREWKPGDVALLTFNDGATGIGVRQAKGDGFAHSAAWAGGSCYDKFGGFDARPLVVIDPEDREQVERLAKAVHESDHIAPWHDLHSETRSQVADAMQDGLREFAEPKPPRPDEPTGLGAVVEDENGTCWIKIDEHADCNDWTRVGAPDNPEGFGPRWKYAEIAVVRVLSEGVQP